MLTRRRPSATPARPPSDCESRDWMAAVLFDLATEGPEELAEVDLAAEHLHGLQTGSVDPALWADGHVRDAHGLAVEHAEQRLADAIAAWVDAAETRP